MRRPSEIQAQTIRYYDEHAEEHADRTAVVELSQIYAPFLKLLPEGGTILDAGCGSGRDTKFFSEQGYGVTAVDASVGYAEEAFKRTGVPVKVMRFQELDYESAFDGIWACASLLHVPRIELIEVLNRLSKALRPSAVIYVSIKEGTEERFDENGRYFNDMNEVTFREQILQTASLRVVKLWLTTEGVPGTQGWLNAILALQDS
jgi:2-polyprenyl-3-methyl-5-hydroxy-6-metoxy-1,4-benzoquinol methylase